MRGRQMTLEQRIDRERRKQNLMVSMITVAALALIFLVLAGVLE